MRLRLCTRFGQVLLGLLMLALTSLPFAHRAGAMPLDPQIAQFIAAGGALSDICGDMSGHTGGTCESCRMVAPVLVPEATQILRPLLVPTLLRRDTQVRPPALLHRAQITPPVRAPPKT